MKKELILVWLFILILPLINAQITGDAITGQITGMTNFSLYILPTLPSIAIISPLNMTYLTNISLLLNYTATLADFIWYNLDLGSNTTITSPLYFNTSQGEHILYLYANNSNGEVPTNVNFTANSTRFIFYFTNYSDVFKGNSTNFSEYTYDNIQNLSNIILENIQYGKILFLQAVNLTNDANPSDNLLDLDNYTNFSSNRIDLNSVALPNLNVPATLWFYNLTLSNPRVMRDGQACPSSICIIESYLAGTLKVNVTGFSTYYVVEETPTTSVRRDTGEGGAKLVTNFSLSLEKIEVYLKQGETKKQELTITNTGNYKIKLNISAPKIEYFMKISEKALELNAGEKKTIVLEFALKEDILPNIYIGKLMIESGGIKKEVLIAMEIVSKKPLFDVKAEIPKEFQQIVPGGYVIANIELFNVGRIGHVDVKVEYEIRDEDNKLILAESETVGVETRASFWKEFNLAQDTRYGTYILYVKAVYNGNTASASAWFEIIGELPLKTERMLYFIVISIIFILAIILLELRSLRKEIKEKIDENVLAKEKLIKLKGGKK